MSVIVDRRSYVAISLPDRLILVCGRASAAIGKWREQERQRRAFAQLDARLLNDIGLTRQRQMWELARWTWLP
jgi:uncharacterized protein YjiS (DUF1127 family)